MAMDLSILMGPGEFCKAALAELVDLEPSG
jgi:hypothetical protein